MAYSQPELNVKKTKFMLFRPKIKPTVYNVSLQFCNESITQAISHRFLGVCLRRDLSRSFHVDNVWAKISKSADLIRRLHNVLPGRVKMQLHLPLIHSQLMCCILVWGICKKTNAGKLFCLQKPCSKSNKLRHPTRCVTISCA